MEVNLRDVIEAIEFEGELLKHFYNKNTGVIMYVEDSSTASYKAEDISKLDEFEEWEQELISALHDLKENPDDYIQLPDENELDEYKMMCKFAESKGKLDIKSSLREMKEEIENKGYLNDWYDYRENIEYTIAKSWCEKNNINYKDNN